MADKLRDHGLEALKKSARDIVDQIINDYEIQTVDDQARAVLEQILAALGGSVNTTPIIFNVALGPVDTEQSQVLPANTKKFTVKTRNNSALKLSYSSGQSGITYIDLKKNAVFTDNNLYATQTIYFQSPNTSDVVEIVAYT